MTILYRGYLIDRDPPPIPDRRHDWRWVHRDYDGPEDGRCGTSPSLLMALLDIEGCIEQTEAWHA